jgi:transposase
MRGGNGGLCERSLLAREIAGVGHDTRLIPSAYVKPFVKRQKNDMADAEAICEAAQRPTMRFVQGKSAEAQASGVIFRTRDLLVRQRTQLINALRGHLTDLATSFGRMSGMSESWSNLLPVLYPIYHLWHGQC